MVWISPFCFTTLPVRRVQGHRLHEVHTGGISSFSLTNMAIAHLMAEGYHLPGRAPKELGQQPVNQDLGHLLWGFLVRFGKVFDYPDQAVSIVQVSQLYLPWLWAVFAYNSDVEGLETVWMAACGAGGLRCMAFLLCRFGHDKA